MKKINQTEERYASVLSDAGFKAVLGDPDNKDLLISIINIILDGERVVHDLEYRNVELGADVTGKKGIRLDLFCRDEMGGWLYRGDAKGTTQRPFLQEVSVLRS